MKASQFEYYKELYRAMRDDPGPVGDKALGEIEAKVPRELGDKLFEIKDVDSPEFEQTFIAFCDKLESAADTEDEPVPKPTGKKQKKKRDLGHLRKARRVSRSREAWRILKDYPAYEVSSHGRCRSLDRVKYDDVLKPRYTFLKGFWIPYFAIADKDGKRRERQAGFLMQSAGFLEIKFKAKAKAAH